MLDAQVTCQMGLDLGEASIPVVPYVGHGLHHRTPIRPIHYLGSKLRIVNLLTQVVDEADSSGGTICDLFAGSGTAALGFAASRTVIAVDIQEYSRVLCSALLNQPSIPGSAVEGFLNKALGSPHARDLSWALEPMVAHEAYCVDCAATGDCNPLCDLLEHPSIIAFQYGLTPHHNPSLLAALQKTIGRLQEVGMLNTPGAIVTRYFGGSYFSYYQASRMDMLLETIEGLPATWRDTFLAAILSSASEVVNTVGKQFAQPIRPRLSDGTPKTNLSRLVMRDRSICVVAVFREWLHRYLQMRTPERAHRVLRSDYRDALDTLHGRVKVVYADPPYTRDHYSRYYHVLETICLRDCPEVSTTPINGEARISRGIYRVNRHQSPFCIKSKAPNAFSTLLTKVRSLDVPLVLSYSPYDKGTEARPRLMMVSEIVELARKVFTSVDVLSVGGIAHSKLNRSDMNKITVSAAETLIVCKP